MLHGRIIFWRDTVAAKDVEPRMLPSGEHPHQLPGNLTLGKKHPEYLVPEDGLQLFQLKRRGDAEHVPAAVETAIRHEDVAVGIESEKISESLDGDDGAGDRIFFGNRIPDKDLQGFPGTLTPSPLSRQKIGLYLVHSQAACFGCCRVAGFS